MKTIIVNGIECVIQSHLKNDFVNLSPIDSELGSIRIDFKGIEPFRTSGKETKKWKEFVAKIDVKKVEEQVSEAFSE